MAVDPMKLQIRWDPPVIPCQQRHGATPQLSGAILVDWLVEVHMKYRLRPETLHRA